MKWAQSLLMLLLSYIIMQSNGIEAQPRVNSTMTPLQASPCWRIRHRGDRTLDHAAHKIQTALERRSVSSRGERCTTGVIDSSNLKGSTQVLALMLSLAPMGSLRPADVTLTPFELQRASQLKPEGQPPAHYKNPTDPNPGPVLEATTSSTTIPLA